MTTAIWCPVSMTSYFDTSNGSVKQVSIYFYRAGTLDPITVWTTSGMSIPHPVPVVSSGYGRVPPIWIGPEGNPAYRFRVFDMYSTLCEDVDNIPGPEFYTGPGEEGTGGTIQPGDARLYATGDLIFAMSNNQPRLGAVLCNGAAIGPTGSVNVGTGGRANNDTEALFKWLWGQDLYGLLPVIPSRGATAQGDWDLGKAITVPDLQGRTIVGMDAMGVPAKNRMAGVTYATGSQEKMGATAGAALHTLDLSQIPSHNHGITETAHQHLLAGVDHLHNDSVWTVGEGGHQHYLSIDSYSENATHTHYQIGGDPTYQGFGDTGGRVSAYQGAQTGGQSTNHQHNVTGWTIAGYGNHAHAVGFASGAADRSLAQWSNTATAGVTSVAVGGGGYHNNVQPIVTVAVYIKL